VPAPAVVSAPALEPVLSTTMVAQADWQSATQPSPLKT
jgi:hypothetical protein